MLVEGTKVSKGERLEAMGYWVRAANRIHSEHRSGSMMGGGKRRNTRV